jgi:hypothetical protein
MVKAPKSVQVSLNLHFVQISGTWEPNEVERAAAWELYVELVTRMAVVPLPAREGLLREALSSLYSLFASTREILRKSGPEIAEPKKSGEYNFGYLAVAMLNFAVRPLLTRWHPTLEDWEAQRPADRSRGEHERAWPQAEELRRELDVTRQTLTAYSGLLATACGVPDLLAAVSSAPAQ